MSDIISVTIISPNIYKQSVSCSQILKPLPPFSKEHHFTMSKDYEGQDPIAIAKQAERDLNSHQAKHGVSTADSSKTFHLHSP